MNRYRELSTSLHPADLIRKERADISKRLEVISDREKDLRVSLAKVHADQAELLTKVREYDAFIAIYLDHEPIHLLADERAPQ